MIKEKNKKRLVSNQNGFVITATVAILILGLVLIIGGLLFLMWLLSNLWNIVLPLLVMIVGGVIIKRFLLEKKGVPVK